MWVCTDMCVWGVFVIVCVCVCVCVWSPSGAGPDLLASPLSRSGDPFTQMSGGAASPLG